MNTIFMWKKLWQGQLIFIIIKQLKYDDQAFPPIQHLQNTKHESLWINFIKTNKIYK